jgi:hypothetical protein
MNAVGRGATQIPGHDTNIGIGNGKRLPQVGIFQVQVGEQPDFHDSEPIEDLSSG